MRLAGERQLWRHWQKICKKSFLGYRGFPQEISGICVHFIRITKIIKNCSHWLQKSVGLRMSLSWNGARMTSVVSFILAWKKRLLLEYKRKLKKFFIWGV